MMAVIAVSLLEASAPKSDWEQNLEDEEQMEYLRKWREQQKSGKSDDLHDHGSGAVVHSAENGHDPQK